ncbi:amidohydrolase [Microbacterium limosum]|uniref:amidohydrolase n=1 Tax=Microbacterium limosum TaxID=3079935 RepID=UPI003BF4F979
MNRGEVVSAIRNARIVSSGVPLPGGDDEPHDVVIAGGRIADIAPAGALRLGGAVLDAAGRWLLPGLWDHHVHTVQWALAAQRVDLGGAATAAEAAAIMGAALVVRGVADDGRRIGTGYRDALWPDRPDLELLDAATGEVPTYLINADVHSVWLNSAALRREGFEHARDGVLREQPAFEISRRLNAVDPGVADAFVARAADAAASRGVVGIVDLDMAWNEEAWARRLANGFDALRVEFGTYPDHLERAVAEGLSTGDTVRGQRSDLVRVGPFKVITDGSLGTRTAACSHPYPGEPHNTGVLTVPPDELVELMTVATGAGLRCAVHAIGDVANSRALDAFALTGATGSIEHAQLVAHADLPRFARLGVAASVQPEHALDDRDITEREWAAQTALAYPLRSLAAAGASLRFGSDAPVSPLDPWAAIAGAVYRTRDGREPWHPHEAVSPQTALDASTHGGSGDAAARIEPGAAADLVLCGADPRTADESVLRSMSVSATLVAGRLTHLA